MSTARVSTKRTTFTRACSFAVLARKSSLSAAGEANLLVVLIIDLAVPKLRIHIRSFCSTEMGLYRTYITFFGSSGFLKRFHLSPLRQVAHRANTFPFHVSFSQAAKRALSQYHHLSRGLSISLVAHTTAVYPLRIL